MQNGLFDFMGVVLEIVEFIVGFAFLFEHLGSGYESEHFGIFS